MRLLILLFLFVSSTIACSQDYFSFGSIVDYFYQELRESYINPALGDSSAQYILSNYKNEKYDTTLNIDEFLFVLKRDIVSVTKDKHLNIDRVPRRNNEEAAIKAKSNKWKTTTPKRIEKSRIKREKKSIKKYDRILDRTIKLYEIDNFDFDEVSILPGNVGYLKFDAFHTAYDNLYFKRDKRVPIRKALNYVRNTEVIIIDFTENRGGSIEHCAKFFGELSGKQNFYLGTLKERSVNHKRLTTELFQESMHDKEIILPDTFKSENIYTPHKRSYKPKKVQDIYVLTSASTFSAGELATFFLKHHSSAKVIGQQTAGGGNSGHFYSYTIGPLEIAHLIPSSTWEDTLLNVKIEGNGVTPDVIVGPDSALLRAIDLIQLNKSMSTDRKKVYYKRKEFFSYKTKIYNGVVKSYVGSFGPFSFKFLTNNLFVLKSVNGVKHPLKQIEKNKFVDEEGTEYLFNKDENEIVVSLTVNLAITKLTKKYRKNL